MKESKENMTFEFLADRPDAIPTIAEWDYEEWGKVPGNFVQKTIERINGKLNRDKPPLYILAISEDRVLGYAQVQAKWDEHLSRKGVLAWRHFCFS